MSRGSHAECREDGSRVSRSRGRNGGRQLGVVGGQRDGRARTKDGGDEEEVPTAT